ncbi:hypothetical protein EJ06DRAFT_533849 [Trichodelitschia bisporula]|uniref:Uncharacterized protein n=1 Tax=Trichodelitschia bisporula TaxID=703511 RepID=A0A6G1HL04_9PEZI|nr:hypothetical protein EJ06DRAFT_533849 [Trichodelitschia bisporula]
MSSPLFTRPPSHPSSQTMSQQYMSGPKANADPHAQCRRRRGQLHDPHQHGRDEYQEFPDVDARVVEEARKRPRHDVLELSINQREKADAAERDDPAYFIQGPGDEGDPPMLAEALQVRVKRGCVINGNITAS